MFDSRVVSKLTTLIYMYVYIYIYIVSFYLPVLIWFDLVDSFSWCPPYTWLVPLASGFNLAALHATVVLILV
jgi:hypothetical protein